jgi:hypothetical protein
MNKVYKKLDLITKCCTFVMAWLETIHYETAQYEPQHDNNVIYKCSACWVTDIKERPSTANCKCIL